MTDPDPELLTAVSDVLRENGEPYPEERAAFALAATGRVLGERLRAASAVYRDETNDFKRGLHAAYLGAAVAVESACGAASTQEGKQR